MPTEYRWQNFSRSDPWVDYMLFFVLAYSPICFGVHLLVQDLFLSNIWIHSNVAMREYQIINDHNCYPWVMTGRCWSSSLPILLVNNKEVFVVKPLNVPWLEWKSKVGRERQLPPKGSPDHQVFDQRGLTSSIIDERPASLSLCSSQINLHQQLILQVPVCLERAWARSLAVACAWQFKSTTPA